MKTILLAVALAAALIVLYEYYGREILEEYRADAGAGKERIAIQEGNVAASAAMRERSETRERPEVRERGAEDAQERPSTAYPVQEQDFEYEGEDHDKIKAAIPSHDETLGVTPSDAIAYLQRGSARAAIRGRQAAIAGHDRALGSPLGGAAAHLSRGSARATIGGRQAAIAGHDRALGSPLGDAAAHLSRGSEKAALGDHEAAITDYGKALEINPNLISAYRARAAANLALGRKKAARSDLMSMLGLARKSGQNGLVALAQKELKALVTMQSR